MPEKPFLLVTCEHGGNDVPPDVATYFVGLEDVLCTHRGWDIGALGVARSFAQSLAAPLQFSTVTRLLVDLNRSPDAPDVFGPTVAVLPLEQRQRLLQQYHTPHCQQVLETVAAATGRGRRVLHVSVHSFTDVLDNTRRDLDLALLFDPSLKWEASIAHSWLEALRRAQPLWRHRLNEPYRGTDDGLTTWLRTRFADEAYAGIEVEVRQGLIGDTTVQVETADLLARTLGLEC